MFFLEDKCRKAGLDCLDTLSEGTVRMLKMMLRVEMPGLEVKRGGHAGVRVKRRQRRGFHGGK